VVTFIVAFAAVFGFVLYVASTVVS